MPPFSAPTSAPDVPNKSHPWLRYGAKLTDWGIILGVLYFVLPSMDMMSNTAFFVSALLLVPYELLFFKYLGTTPGKMLYNITLSHKAKSFPLALHLQRSIWSVAAGLGLGFMYFQILTFPYQYWSLKTTGQADYDNRLNITVSHSPLTLTQKAIIALTHVLAFWILCVYMLSRVNSLMGQIGA